MTALKITAKMFSGGNTKHLADVLRRFAIDNARLAFEQMDQPALLLDNKMKGVLPIELVAIPIPRKGVEEQEIPQTFWEMTLDASEAMQLIANQVNKILERFGIPEIANAKGVNRSIQPIMMLISDDPPEVHGHLNYAGAMSQLRDSLTAIANRISDIKVALGGERFKGNTFGSVKCNQIYPIMMDRKGGVGTNLRGISDFLDAFNENLFFLVGEWNLMLGTGEKNFTFTTDINFDDAIMSIPAIKTTSKIELQNFVGRGSWDGVIGGLGIQLRLLELLVEEIGQRYAIPVVMTFERLTDVTKPDEMTIWQSSLIAPKVPGDIAGELREFDQFDVIEDEDHQVFYALHSVNEALTALVMPINHALAISGHMTIVDVREPTKEPDKYMYCSQLQEIINAQFRCICTLSKGLETVMSIQFDLEDKSLKAIAS